MTSRAARGKSPQFVPPDTNCNGTEPVTCDASVELSWPSCSYSGRFAEIRAHLYKSTNFEMTVSVV